MIFELSPKERKGLQSLTEGYSKLIKDVEAQIIELAPATPRPDDIKLFDEWLASGSQEWRDAREKRSELIRAQAEARAEYLRSVYRAHFDKLGGDPEAIVRSAFEEIDNDIIATYNAYEEARTTGISEYGTKVTSFSAANVRATDTGFLLDADETVKRLFSSVVSLHLQALKEDPERTARINDYIVKAVTESPYTSSEVGELGGLVKTEVGLKTQPLDKATVLITRLMDIAFDGNKRLERDYNKDFGDPTNRYDLGIYSKDCPYNLKVAIDYNAMIDNKLVKLPALTRLAKHIYNAIVSYWLQGNYTPTYRQIWRATCGNIKREIKYGTKEKLTIEKALLSFKANIAYSTGEIVELNDKKVAKIKEAGGAYQLLHYDTKFVKINGQRTDVLILDPNRKPILLEIAFALNNQYMTDNISFFDVKGLVATEENLDLKEYLFIRIKKMKNPNNSIKQKKIALDTLIKDLKIDPFDKTDAKDRVRKSRLVERITKILDNAVDVNFIESYTANKRNGSTEVISFTIEPYKKRCSASSVT